MEISVVSHVQRSKASNGYKTNERFETALEMCLAGLEKLGDRAILQLVWVMVHSITRDLIVMFRVCLVLITAALAAIRHPDA